MVDRISFKEAVKRFRAFHGYAYSYDETSYKGINAKIKITCPKHGVFETVGASHAQGSGCPKCRNHKVPKISWEKYFASIPVNHSAQFVYDAASYNGSLSKIRIKCKKHGWFTQQAYIHKVGSGCPKCRGRRIREAKVTPFSEVVKELRKVHGSTYQYNEDDYVNSYTKIKITCPKHGVFKQTPEKHKAAIVPCPKMR